MIWINWPKVLLIAAIIYVPLAVLFTCAQIFGERIADTLIKLLHHNHHIWRHR